MKEIKIGDYYDLKQSQKTIVSRKEENGYEDQYFEREDIKWIVLDKTEEKITLIAEKPTEQEIILSGEIGQKNSIKVLDKLCRDISGVENARSLKKEDLEKLEYWKDKDDIRKKIIFGEDNEFYYWLATQDTSLCSSYAYFCVFFVSSSSVRAYSLYYSNGYTYSPAYAVRPVISINLKSNIQ